MKEIGIERERERVKRRGIDIVKRRGIERERDRVKGRGKQGKI